VDGAATFSITTFSIKALSITIKNVIPSIPISSILLSVKFVVLLS
jgi:hypothetical protein